MFGYALMAAGVLRIIEVCFVLEDKATPHGVIRAFQHLPPYVSTGLSIRKRILILRQLLVLGGTLFMSATNEEMRNADK